MNSTTSYERQYITVDGQRLAYIAQGDPSRPPLLMVHGWVSHAGLWRQTIEAFRDSHYCVSVDLLGHGYSDKPKDGDYSIPANANRVLKLADALGLKQFTFIGHSMGGQIGLYIAATLPERITKLVDVAGVVTGQLSNYLLWVHQPVMWMGALFPPVWILSRQMMRFRWYSDIFDRPIFRDTRVIRYDSEDRRMGFVKGIEVPAYREMQAIAALNLTEMLLEVKTPTLVIFGRHDGTVPAVNGELVKQHIPNSQLVWIEDCGHAPMVEKPALYLEAVRAFLSV